MIINGFENFYLKFAEIIQSESWIKCQNDFNSSTKVLAVGNGGNLAVCDHGAIDIARLTNKNATAPGSGILASSLINDASHDLWVKNWLSITIREYSREQLSNIMLIGVSSSGYSKNICIALDEAVNIGCKAVLISAQNPKIDGTYNTIVLDVNEYHTSEVLTLALFYQLIYGAGFTCPTIADSTSRNLIDDYTR
jgi:phosphoheptose isomerase